MSKLPQFRGFVLDRLLGVGATAEVFSARNTDANRRVALKVFSSIVSSDVELVERLQAEAEILERLRHPNVVATYGVQKYDDEFAIELELIEGVDLRKWIDAHRAKVALIEPAIWALAQISRGLGAAHEIGVLHRDLKPENVLISNKGDVKITDFGLARTVTRVTMTRVGLLVGSLGYLAPEVVNGERATPQSDLFSLGVIAYEMLVGRPPFVGETPQSLIQKLTSGIFQSTCEAAPHIPRDIGALVDSCLARNPSLRPRSVWEIEAKLMTVLSTGPLMRFSKMLLATSLAPNETDELTATALRMKREWLIENSSHENRGWILPEFHRLFPQDSAITEIIEKSAGADSQQDRRRAGWISAAIAAIVVGFLLLNIHYLLPAPPRIAPPAVAAVNAAEATTILAPVSAYGRQATPAATEKPSPVTKTHTVKTETNGTLAFEVPEDVNVYVADVLVPREELAAYKIAAGRYPMRMVKDGFLPIESMVDVKAGRVAVIRAGSSK